MALVADNRIDDALRLSSQEGRRQMDELIALDAGFRSKSKIGSMSA
jgi:hypothetical protein